MHTQTEKDLDIVAPWLRFDPTRILAGVLTGMFSGVVALVFGGILARMGGLEFIFPVKVMALPILGSSATELGLSGGGVTAVVVGLVCFELLCAVLGGVFAHFVFSNAAGPLLGMGFTWGAFSWIFINNLFSPSFLAVRAADISRGAAFGFWMAFGLSLTTLAFFDRMVRGQK